MVMNKLEKKVFLHYRLTLVTGLRIGDSKERVEIGGVDAPIVRRKDNYAPYLPGSSIKGKMRCLLELMAGENGASDAKNTGTLICQLFGAGENNNPRMESRQSRLIVRDADLTSQWEKTLRESTHTDLPYTEIKWENVINRLKGTAEHPRQLERIPAGAEFDVHFVINCFETEPYVDYEALLTKGLEAMQDDYLGGSGSRGYGQVQLELVSRREKSRTEYLAGTGIA